MTWQSAGRAIWRYKWLFVALTAWLVISTAVFVGRQPSEYEATSTVRIIQRVQAGDQPALETAARNAGSYSVLISGSNFADFVVGRLATELPDLTPGEVQGTITGEPVPSTDIIRITARGGDPERLATLANAAPVALRSLAAEIAPRTENIQLVDEADVPINAVAPRVNLAIAVALIVGLIVNGALMVLLDLLRDRYANPDELAEATGRPVLATVPIFSRGSFEKTPDTPNPAVAAAPDRAEDSR